MLVAIEHQVREPVATEDDFIIELLGLPLCFVQFLLIVVDKGELYTLLMRSSDIVTTRTITKLDAVPDSLVVDAVRDLYALAPVVVGRVDSGGQDRKSVV